MLVPVGKSWDTELGIKVRPGAQLKVARSLKSPVGVAASLRILGLGQEADTRTRASPAGPPAVCPAWGNGEGEPRVFLGGGFPVPGTVPGAPQELNTHPR